MEVNDKIYRLDVLKQQVQDWKKDLKKIVFTNGCFDIIHLGHVDYLEKARRKGDKLIVGINSDASVQRLKGPDRPIVTEASRKAVLACLMFVDAVVVFDEDTPLHLIKEIQPDILIKGNDYSVKNIVGAEFVMGNGGKVLTIDLVPGFSTSSIIEKIKKLK
ncbi:MAG: D-glycero-beta-D-manno-heptose 1-phosphate adenylyltransferase [Bacteroidota bacterium]|nr:D-glycero-beta-D-manno-heptose 1-phosphate adenylyltransferase [Bacteroidota bacterium]